MQIIEGATRAEVEQFKRKKKHIKYFMQWKRKYNKISKKFVNKLGIQDWTRSTFVFILRTFMEEIDESEEDKLALVKDLFNDAVKNYWILKEAQQEGKENV